jgi:hypothetical protein
MQTMAIGRVCFYRFPLNFSCALSLSLSLSLSHTHTHTIAPRPTFICLRGRLRRSYIRGPSARRRGAASSRAAEAECRVREQGHIARHSQHSHGTCATAITANASTVSFPLPCSSQYYPRGGAASSSLGHCTQRVSSRLTLPQCTDTVYTRIHTCIWRHGDMHIYTHTHACMYGCI